MLLEAPSYAASVTDFLTYLLTGFPSQRHSLEVIFVLLRALDRTWLKGKLPIKWSGVLDLTHHHSQISKEEPHPWELEKGKVIALENIRNSEGREHST